ncbi:MAG: hypothetical protein QW196_07545 [Sulfolobales archaeon]
MDAQLEIMKKLLIESYREWLERNRELLGEDGYRRFMSRIQHLSSANAQTVIVYVLNIVGTYLMTAVANGTCVNVDRESTEKLMKWIHIVALHLSTW